MGIGKINYVDKDALLQEGKLFLQGVPGVPMEAPRIQGWWGKEALACELIEEGKRKTAVTRKCYRTVIRRRCSTIGRTKILTGLTML